MRHRSDDTIEQWGKEFEVLTILDSSAELIAWLRRPGSGAVAG
ncbi:hypothetical protein OHA77_05480 [Streptosporangium sp. NBC_01639]|nr:hypothetical protein [Streptosporangium sp. NBC_01756]WSC85371.1 hypothetical protein OIE48_34225 [Streptosporangium sp. NBC_01756]WTD55993.1 hypothetical protein OHA77_05480 [Streptosporangium sp. NBC_01639]